jgi:hypothetical protein
MDKKQQKGKEKANKALRDQIRKYERILRTKGEKALEESKQKDSERLTKLAEKRLTALLKKIGPRWYEEVDPEKSKTVYDYWLELIRFSNPKQEAEFKAFLERGKEILEKIEAKVDVHYVLWQLAQIAWGEVEKPLAERVADKIITEYPYIDWNKEKLLSSMDAWSRQTRMYRGTAISKAKTDIRGKGAPPDTELNEVIVCLTEHFRGKLGGPRWNTTTGLLKACHKSNEESYFDQEKIKKRYKYWVKKNQLIITPIQLYQSSLKTFDPFRRDLRVFLAR